MAPRRNIYPRTRCCVPGCKRTSTRFPDEWICGRHWSLVPKKMKKVLARIHRKCRRYPHMNRTVQRLMRAEERIWQRIRRAAIESAHGV